MADYEYRLPSDGSDSDYVDLAQPTHNRKMSLDKSKSRKTPHMSVSAQPKPKPASKSSVTKGRRKTDPSGDDATSKLKKPRGRKAKKEVGSNTTPPAHAPAPHGYQPPLFSGGVAGSPYTYSSPYGQSSPYATTPYTQSSPYAHQASPYTPVNGFGNGRNDNGLGNGFDSPALDLGMGSAYQFPISFGNFDNRNHVAASPYLGHYPDQAALPQNGYSGGFSPPPGHSNDYSSNYNALLQGNDNDAAAPAGNSGGVNQQQDDGHEEDDDQFEEEYEDGEYDEYDEELSHEQGGEDPEQSRSANSAVSATKDGARKKRAPRPPLRKWNDPDWKMAVLGIVWACGEEGLRIPFDKAAKIVAPTVSGGGLQQALLKLRNKMEGEGRYVDSLKMNWTRKNGAGAKNGTGSKKAGEVSARRRNKMKHRSTQANIRKLYGTFEPQDRVFKKEEVEELSMQGHHVEHAFKAPAAASRESSYERSLRDAFPIYQAHGNQQLPGVPQAIGLANNMGMSAPEALPVVGQLGHRTPVSAHQLTMTSPAFVVSPPRSAPGSFGIGPATLSRNAGMTNAPRPHGPSPSAATQAQRPAAPHGQTQAPPSMHSFENPVPEQNFYDNSHFGSQFVPSGHNGLQVDNVDLSAFGTMNGMGAVDFGNDFGGFDLGNVENTFSPGQYNNLATADFGANDMQNGLATFDETFAVFNDGNNDGPDLSRQTDGTLDIPARQFHKKPVDFKIYTDVNENHVRAWNRAGHPQPLRSAWENAENWPPQSIFYRMDHAESREDGPLESARQQHAHGGDASFEMEDADFSVGALFVDLDESPSPSPQE
ncbi:hypothetical protein BDV96DRAFT_606416 [Lophiotrema nucula]|uniref:Uncharacterized protein n=1 Tax=Lophiotrema nucula TaxID=690887 RepID=A0A6A5YKH4_9PLEO|nr:hypothetical protein BDV96DRAFT_606416 [Lophiotrema nucula]